MGWFVAWYILWEISLGVLGWLDGDAGGLLVDGAVLVQLESLLVLEMVMIMLGQVWLGGGLLVASVPVVWSVYVACRLYGVCT